MKKAKTKTWKDFDSREEFFRYLGYYHYDKNKSDKDSYVIMGRVTENFDSEVAYLKENIEHIKKSWNDQSPAAVAKSVKELGPRAEAVMAAQANDKKLAGYKDDAPMYRTENTDPNSIFYKIAKKLGLDFPLCRWHVQFPGETTFWHVDIFHPAHKFLPPVAHNIPDERVGHDPNIRRLMIALEDWDWGQMMLFGKTTYVNWRKGDIVYWPFGMPHAMANCGLAPRMSVSITGMQTGKFKKNLRIKKNY